MRNLLLQDSVPRQTLASSLPRDLEEAEQLAALIEARIHAETGGGISDLNIEIRECDILLQGRCRTFYCKQRAQEAARAIASDRRLHNAIEVG